MSAARDAVLAAICDARGPVVLCAHVDPDGDAVGSVLGLTLALRSLGLDVRPRLADDAPAPARYRFLQGWSDLAPVDSAEAPDVLVALDCTDAARLGLARPLVERARVVAVIDHHPDNAHFGTHDWTDETAPAVGAMLWEALPVLGVEPDPEIATCLYVALMTDTGRFTYDNTGASAYRIAAEMIDAGADPAPIARAIYQAHSTGRLALTGLVLGRIALANEGHVAYSWFDQDDLAACGATMADTEDLVDWVRALDGPDVAVLAKIIPGETRLSLRAKGPADVGAVARTLGGGGHRAAAGATVFGDLNAALSVMLPLLPGGND